MTGSVFVYVGCSVDVGTGLGGTGWVAVRGSDIAFGVVPVDEALTVRAIETAAARNGVVGALDAFPGCDRLLLTGDGNALHGAPWGAVADGMDDGHDPTGVLGACRERGVRHAVRWWPGHHAGPGAADILLLLARGLAIRGRMGGRQALGKIEAAVGLGWRTALVAAIGRGWLERALKKAGLEAAEAAILLGIDEADIAGLRRSARLRTNGHGMISVSSAYELRDELERTAAVSFAEDDFGAAELDRLTGPAALTLCLGYHPHGGAVGVSIARRWRDVFKVSSEIVRAGSPADAERTAAARALGVLARRIGDFEAGGTVDVVTSDPVLASLLTGRAHARPHAAAALADLRAKADARGVVLRPRLVVSAVLREWMGNEIHGLMAAATFAARATAFGPPWNVRCDSLVDGPDSLVALSRRAAGTAAAQVARREQALVTEALFGLVPDEGAARARFESLAEDVRCAYAGYDLPRPLLPGGIAGLVAVLGEHGAIPAGPGHPALNELAGRWEGWRAEYAGILAGNPALALREALLRIDPALDLTDWPKERHHAVVAWARRGEACPFPLKGERREEARREIGALLGICGVWPFAWRQPAMAA